MVSKLPRWAWFGGWALALVAGMINVVGFLGFEHQAVTHLTGNISMLAIEVEKGEVRAALRLGAIIGSFVAGAIVSGFLIQHSTLRLGRPYGIVLLMESALLAAAVPFFHWHSLAGICLAAGACGLQNAMVTTFSGTAIRTTHLSGMVTDLGVFLGHWLRGISVDLLRLKLCFLIITAFFLGGISGTALFRIFGYATLFLPSAVTGLAACTYIILTSAEGRRSRAE